MKTFAQLQILALVLAGSSTVVYAGNRGSGDHGISPERAEKLRKRAAESEAKQAQHNRETMDPRLRHTLDSEEVLSGERPAQEKMDAEETKSLLKSLGDLFKKKPEKSE
jgi:hypothetical protein